MPPSINRQPAISAAPLNFEEDFISYGATLKLKQQHWKILLIAIPCPETIAILSKTIPIVREHYFWALYPLSYFNKNGCETTIFY